MLTLLIILSITLFIMFMSLLLGLLYVNIIFKRYTATQRFAATFYYDISKWNWKTFLPKFYIKLFRN